MNIKELVKQRAAELAGELSGIRRHLHMHPELSMQESETSAFLAHKLQQAGIPFERGIAKHGIVALIEGRDPSKKVIGLRADMDALPIIEENETAYCSTVPGVMHACGHDVHMTCVLGAAMILHEIRDRFEGTIKLLFQPSEETFPGGASMMISEGVMENPAPVNMFGQHVLPGLEAGKIGLKPGKYMASTDEVYITVKGKGGHAATPDLVIDPVLIGSHVVVALQQIVSRIMPPTLPAVLSFGSFQANGRTNIIPNEAKIAGTLRTFDENWRAIAHRKIAEITNGVVQSMGGECEVFISKGYPFLVNDDKVTAFTKSTAIDYLGEENVVDLEMRLTAEDFAYFTHMVPSCFYRLGVADESRGIVHNLHTPKFDVDEKCLETGAGFMAYLALASLSAE